MAFRIVQPLPINSAELRSATVPKLAALTKTTSVQELQQHLLRLNNALSVIGDQRLQQQWQIHVEYATSCGDTACQLAQQAATARQQGQPSQLQELLLQRSKDADAAFEQAISQKSLFEKTILQQAEHHQQQHQALMVGGQQDAPSHQPNAQLDGAQENRQVIPFVQNGSIGAMDHRREQDLTIANSHVAFLLNLRTTDAARAEEREQKVVKVVEGIYERVIDRLCDDQREMRSLVREISVSNGRGIKTNTNAMLVGAQAGNSLLSANFRIENAQMGMRPQFRNALIPARGSFTSNDEMNVGSFIPSGQGEATTVFGAKNHVGQMNNLNRIFNITGPNWFNDQGKTGEPVFGNSFGIDQMLAKLSVINTQMMGEAESQNALKVAGAWNSLLPVESRIENAQMGMGPLRHNATNSSRGAFHLNDSMGVGASQTEHLFTNPEEISNKYRNFPVVTDHLQRSSGSGVGDILGSAGSRDVPLDISPMLARGTDKNARVDFEASANNLHDTSAAVNRTMISNGAQMDKDQNNARSSQVTSGDGAENGQMTYNDVMLDYADKSDRAVANAIALSGVETSSTKIESTAVGTNVNARKIRFEPLFDDAAVDYEIPYENVEMDYAPPSEEDSLRNTGIVANDNETASEFGIDAAAGVVSTPSSSRVSGVKLIGGRGMDELADEMVDIPVDRLLDEEQGSAGGPIRRNTPNRREDEPLGAIQNTLTRVVQPVDQDYASSRIDEIAACYEDTTRKRGHPQSARVVVGGSVQIESEGEVRQMGDRGQKWMANLEKFPVGSPEFLKVFAKEEKIIVNRNVHLQKFSNAEKYEQKLGPFQHPVLFENSDGLGMVIPYNLNLDNLEEFVDCEQLVHVIQSSTLETVEMTWRRLIQVMTSEDPDAPVLNLLSHEFSSLNTRLNQFVRPQFVRDSSIVAMVEEKMKKKYEELEAMKQNANSKTRKSLGTKLKSLKKKMDSIPRMEQFFLVSKKNSFTDIHVDPSGTAVYYHVICGRKVFYLAKNTKENLEQYKNSEIGDGEEWLGKHLLGEFQRLEIGPGETAMIPSGWLHFVFTPETSLVIGGNFLMESSIPMQFEVTKIEEAALEAGNIQRGNMFMGFYNIMWAYVELVLPEKLNDPACPHCILEVARELLRMVPEEKELKCEGRSIDWYTTTQKRSIKEKLKRDLEQAEAREAAKAGPSQRRQDLEQTCDDLEDEDENREPQEKKTRKE